MTISATTQGIKPGVCLSTARPANPFEGMTIYETDTDLLSAYNGSAWVYQSPLRFTTEAARDAVITAPTEGMIAYLTAPTVPAATSTAYLPTGIQTIYNGSVWVCVTPVGSKNPSSSQAFTGSYVDVTALGTVLSVTLVTGTTALVSFSGRIQSNGTYARLSVKTTTVASSDEWAVFNRASVEITCDRTFIFSGLTAGTNTFTMQCMTHTSGSVADQMYLTVQGIA